MNHLEYVQDLIKRKKISKSDIIERANLSPNILTGCDRKDWNPRWKTLHAIEKAINDIWAERAA